jgi:RimJ/RimL family protein N-acetyltransferase
MSGARGRSPGAALAAGDVPAAELAIGARVGASLVRDPSHVIQLHVAQQAAEAAGLVGTARVIVLRPAAARRVIGSVGFHGLADNRGRLEAGCRIDDASHGHGYGVEALTALLEFATVRFGLRRFLVAVPYR